ncbi:MAG: decaprenyl-phosphate phosphoribosyltransferase [Ignavibacteria bacterium]
MRETLAIFDFDGTLTRGDTLFPFLRFVAGVPRFLVRLVKLLPTLARFALRRVPNDWTKEEVLRAFVRGMPEAELARHASAFAAERLPRMMRPAALRRLAWHRERGHRCVLLSASPAVYIEPWARAQGFDDVLATRLGVDPQGRVTGLLDGGNCHGAAKLQRLEERFGDLGRFEMYGYGDSASDRHFLARCARAEFRPFRERSPAGPRNRLRDLIRLLRPHQWLKSGFVLIGPIFGHAWNDTRLVVGALLAAAAFSLAASAVYVFNDFIDMENDRHHPRKRNRPLASGRVTPLAAALVCAALLIGAGLLSVAASPAVLLIIAGYIVLNIAYTVRLKQIVILDVFVIAGGFMLRILAGTAGLGIAPSDWLVFCGFLLTLFLGFTKRRAESLGLGEAAAAHRQSMAEYRGELLDKLIAVCAGCVIMSYTLYTLNPETIRLHGTSGLIYTVPFVIYGLFRYLYLLHNDHRGTDTSDDLVRDPHLLGSVLGWALVTVLLIARPGMPWSPL